MRSVSRVGRWDPFRCSGGGRGRKTSIQKQGDCEVLEQFPRYKKAEQNGVFFNTPARHDVDLALVTSPRDLTRGCGDDGAGFTIHTTVVVDG